MKAVITYLLPLCCLLFLNLFSAQGQEETAMAAYQGKRYVDLRIKAIDKYNSRIEAQQKKMLKKLSRKEKRFASKLKNTDSLGYAKYIKQPLSYDSIRKLTQADSATQAAATPKKKNRTIDNLKGVETFVAKESTTAYPNAPQDPGYASKLNQEQSKLNFRSYVTELITQRTRELKGLAANENIPGLKGIDKQAFYSKSKMNVYKEWEDDPTKAEDKAMEYLQGTEGFDSHMDKSMNGGGANSIQDLAGGNTSSSDLEKMGFQTKSLLQSSLKAKFGSSLGAVGQNLSKQIVDYQSKAKDITGNISVAKQSTQFVKQLTDIDKPSFKVNPMRGLPFRKRIEKQLNWQMTKATLNGAPAILETSAMAGYKQTARLTYGLGIATGIGLGQNWNNIHFSVQGIGFRTYTTWLWQYGLGAYGGYERMYKQAVFVNNAEASTAFASTRHNTALYSESLLAGLTKNYRINSKWSGQIQVLYDFWWQEKGLSSPIIFRFSTIKN